MKYLLAEEEGILRSVRFRVHATIHMQRLLPQWFGACRAVYNRCVDSDKNMKTSAIQLKKQIVTGTKPEEWMNDCPNHLRSEAIRDYCGGRKAALSAYQKKLWKFQQDQERWEQQGKRWKQPVKPKPPVMKHRTKKSPRSVLHIPKDDIEMTKNGFKLLFTRTINQACRDTNVPCPKRRHHSDLLSVNSRTKRKDKKFLELLKNGGSKHDVRLIRYRDGRLIIEVPVDVQPINTPTPQFAVGIDPGLRTPLATAGTDGIIMEMGAKFKENVKIHRERKGKLQSRLSKTIDKAKRKRIKKQIGRLHSKITNTRTQFHYEAIKELTSYTHIYLPKTSYKGWNRGLDRNSRRTCQEVAHPLLRNRLINKSEILGGGRVVYNCSEYMTTKTCSSCFRVHDKIGSSEVFTCPSCGVTVGRDHNAARNILLINLRV
jgi:transposase